MAQAKEMFCLMEFSSEQDMIEPSEFVADLLTMYFKSSFTTILLCSPRSTGPVEFVPMDI